MTVAAYLRQWLQGKQPDLEQSTYEAYQIYLEKHIIPYFNELNKPLEALRPLDIKGYVTAKRISGRQDGRPGGLSAVSVRKHLNIIKQAFREAVLYEILPASPAEPVRLPPAQDLSPQAKFISLPQSKEILAAFEGHYLYPLVLVTLYYGLRRSEVLGLRWSAVDFATKEVRIVRTVVKNVTIVEKDRTKTVSSRRTFPLVSDVANVLQQMKPGKADGYIFARADGRPLRPDTVTKGFQRVLRAHYLPPMRFHDLRHATASILFDQGWSIVDVQTWLGHADIETTRNIYIAYNATRKVKMGGTLDGLFK